jgi:RNA polymerase sigma-70 factor (ECF subfamily)
LTLPGVDGAASVEEAAVTRIFHEEFGRCVASLVRVFGDIDVAEDAVQEAFAVALRRWPGDGLPPNPGGWITTTARNHAIDRLRREARGRELLAEIGVPASNGAVADIPEEVVSVPDDRLALMFTCCHPALSSEAQVALTLRLLGGLSTNDVARAFLVSEPTMAQRIVRAKRKIKAARIPFRVPDAHELSDRLGPVLAVVYLVYNAGAGSETKPDLCAEGVRLARLLVEQVPDEPDVEGLLALLLLTESRRAARAAPGGSFVVLSEQDRGQWDRALIDEGLAIVRRCVRRNRPGPYQLQAAINAVHADAATFEQTDWSQIVALYDQLLHHAPTPVVALNRAVAVGELRGAATALALVDELDLDSYHPYHATRADLLRRLGRTEEAGAAYGRAAALAPTGAERDLLLRRAGRL